jgi:hypothetical protein
VSDLPEKLPDDFDEQFIELSGLTLELDKALDNLLSLLRRDIIRNRGHMRADEVMGKWVAAMGDVE